MSKVSRLITQKREEKGLTQYELADELGVSVLLLDKWEKGEQEMSEEEYKKVSAILGIDEADMLNELKKPSEIVTKSKENSKQIAASKVGTVLILLSVIAYLLIGVFVNVWHPTWIMIPISILVSWIINTVFK